ncbi:MAG: ectoine synthase [Pseudomonadota bacterium]
MIVVDKADLIGSLRDAKGPGWNSVRLLVAADGTGFSMTETKVEPGTVLDLHYKHHIEACFCLSGTATVTDLETGREHQITSGMLYALDMHDPHRVEVTSAEPWHLICVFSPALRGDEVHGADGSYASGASG